MDKQISQNQYKSINNLNNTHEYRTGSLAGKSNENKRSSLKNEYENNSVVINSKNLNKTSNDLNENSQNSQWIQSQFYNPIQHKNSGNHFPSNSMGGINQVNIPTGPPSNINFKQNLSQ